MADHTTPEQDIQYKSLASGQLTQALLSLWAAERLCDNCAANQDALSALIRDAIVLYGGAFNCSDVSDRHSVKLSQESYIPEHFEALHDDLLAHREALVAGVGFESGNPRRGAETTTGSGQRPAKDTLDFEEEIPNIKALILGIICQKLWPEILDEHQELLEKPSV
jgi:hypothetical protein